MTVLLVDDQISILSGLMSGLDWDALGITSVRTAGNAIQAREILEKERIDVLLCDIEMPGENGLSLLRWARRQGMDFVCIFLTSHADFSYAQESIKLGCFDYVVQPAPYQEIEDALLRAIAKVHTEAEKNQYYKDGLFYTNHKQELTDRTIFKVSSFSSKSSHWRPQISPRRRPVVSSV